MNGKVIPAQSPVSNRLWIVGVCVWGILVAAGTKMLWDYRDTPGTAAEAPSDWPADSGIQRDRDRATLVMLAHPKCPCTRASVKELGRLMTLFQGRVNAHVLVLKLAEFGPNWEKTETWKAAEIIPGVTVAADLDGREAAHFGAITSGQILLYDKSGRLLFSGGITPGRGHEGDNAGRQRILSILDTGKADLLSSQVYGCPIFTVSNSMCPPILSVAMTEGRAL